jgi:cyclopropane fatty-acyl-phospholipid synthase-like methyltransferase
LTRYRDRIYRHYVAAASTPLAPANVAGLEPRRAVLTRLIAEYFPAARDARILELGCGHGALLHFAREAGYTNLSGIDASPAQVAAARQLGIADVQQGELLPALRAAAPASHDAVVAYDVIEHLTKDELLDMADEVARVLKPGGRWIIHAPNGLSPFCGVMAYGDLTHEQAFTPESLTQLFLACGFRTASFHEDPPAVRGLPSAVRAALWALIRQLIRFSLVVETGMTQYRVLTMNLIAVAVK